MVSTLRYDVKLEAENLLPSGAARVRLLLFVAFAEQQAALLNFGLDLAYQATSHTVDLVDVARPRSVREVEAHRPRRRLVMKQVWLAPGRLPFQ